MGGQPQPPTTRRLLTLLRRKLRTKPKKNRKKLFQREKRSPLVLQRLSHLSHRQDEEEDVSFFESRERLVRLSHFALRAWRSRRILAVPSPRQHQAVPDIQEDHQDPDGHLHDKKEAQ